MTTCEETRDPGERPCWILPVLASAIPLALLASIDLALRALSIAPPEDPLLFYARTRSEGFSPFITNADGSRSIRPDWVVGKYGIRQRRLGARNGRHFLYPGFRPARVAMPKPEGLVRIAALGGSTTFGLFVGADEAFSAQLERRLSEELAPRTVEVINLGCPGWASDRIVNIFDAVLELDPDFIVVYSGHNEMLEGDIGPMPGLTLWSRLRVGLLRASTLFQWLNHAIAGAMRAEDASEVAEEMAAVRVGSVLTFDPREVDEEEREPASDAFVEFTVERYARNVATMIGRARAAGVGIAFIRPVGNLRFPPSLSAHAEGFDRVAEFKTARNAAKRAIKQGRIAEAIGHLDRAAEISPRHAMIHYRHGFVLQQVGHTFAAREAFQRAADRDLRTHRMTTAHAAALAEVAGEAGIPQIDLRPDFHARLTDAEAERLFFDHLHPTVAGHAIVAERVLVPVRDHLTQSEGGSERDDVF